MFRTETVFKFNTFLCAPTKLRKPGMNPWGQAARQVQFKKRIMQIVWMPQGLFETIHWYLATENKLLKASPTALTHNCHLRAVVSCVVSSRNVSKTGCWTTSRCIQHGKLKLRHWHLIIENFTGNFFPQFCSYNFFWLEKWTNPSKQKNENISLTYTTWHNQSWADPTERWCLLSLPLRHAAGVLQRGWKVADVTLSWHANSGSGAHVWKAELLRCFQKHGRWGLSTRLSTAMHC